MPLAASFALLAEAAAAVAPPVTAPAAVIRRYPAPEARQGVAVDACHVYAVSNWTIVKYDKASGEKLAEWRGDPVRFPHINACTVIRAELVCANSNFPATPHTSSVEFFDPVRLTHKRTISLGLGTGSLTWVDRWNGAWYGLYANYDDKGGEPPRDHRHTVLVRFDDAWRRTQAWSFPATVLDRFAPTSSSGGAFGRDGLLYVTGHDHKELYVLKPPTAGGSVLEHLATIPADIEGQAIDWDESAPGVLYGISRPSREIRALRIPPIAR